MPARSNRKPKITPKYLLDRIDYQFYAASTGLKRLKISLRPDSQDFQIDVQKEIKHMKYRFDSLLKRLKQLAALPKSSWT
jgi:Na+-translocating ferredoxin:NAD+ oxidoreductase RnfC subunit